MTFLLLVEPLCTEYGFFPLELNWSAFTTRLGAPPSQDWEWQCGERRSPKGGIW